MRTKKHIIFLFLNILIVALTHSQVIDTLSYYYPYYPDSLNSGTFVYACHQPGYCEPIAVYFTPDSTNVDSTFNIYSIKEIRFCCTGFDQQVSYSVHLTDSLPSSLNKIYDDTFTLAPEDYNTNFFNDGIYIFKNIDVSTIPSLQKIDRDFGFWVNLNEKVFCLYNTDKPITHQTSGHSFYNGLPSNLWRDPYCDWILEVVVEFDHITSTEASNSNTIYQTYYKLYQNYPNPLNSNETIIKYKIGKMGIVTISAYDLLGKKITDLVNKIQTEGIYEATLNLNGLTSGTYIYTLRIDGKFLVSRRMIIIK